MPPSVLDRRGGLPPRPAVEAEEVLPPEQLSILLQDCPICLESMQEEDLLHPLQCKQRCGYNFCQDCIESLIVSSKDDYMEASDGNRHVKVFLHCPNCRSNLSATIRDTLLLRRADTVRRLVKQKEKQQNGSKTRKNMGSPRQQEPPNDKTVTELTESQHRLWEVLYTPPVQNAIQQARKLEAEYMGLKRIETASFSRTCGSSSSSSLVVRSSSGCFSSSNSASSSSSSQREQHRREMSTLEAAENESFTSLEEEWGVEADLMGGVHESFRMPNSSHLCNTNNNKNVGSRDGARSSTRATTSKVDLTLFAGLEDFLTDEQREKITLQMTSGDPNQLAAASLQLWQVLYGDNNSNNESRAQSSNKPAEEVERCSVFELIAEAQAAHEKFLKEAKKKGETNDHNDCSEEKKTVDSLDSIHRHPARRTNTPLSSSIVGNNLPQQLAFQKAFPLPVRMPKTVELSSIPNNYLTLRQPGAGSSPPNSKQQQHQKWDYYHHMIQLVDYEWDGTVMDAYSKISIGFLRKIHQPQRPAARNNPGVQRILGRGMDGQIEWPGQKRVLIHDAGRQAGRQGAVRGDVVTHINGQPIEKIFGGSSSSGTSPSAKSPTSSSSAVDDTNTTSAAAQVERSLLLMLHKQKQQLQSSRRDKSNKVEKIMVTLNAERSVAEALKRRALTIAEAQKQKQKQ
ncbi:hypothetical protein ACA910_012293 [Epithemia clementina (nom. ined.)]